MKRTSLFQTMGALVFVVALMMTSLSSNAFAAGTLAGTAISNQATVGYNAGSNARTTTSNTTILYVAHKITANFAPASGASSGVDNATYTISGIIFYNTGNRNDVFNIATYGKTGYTVSVLDSNDAVITQTITIQPDMYQTVKLKIVVAASIADNDTTKATLTFVSTATNSGNIVVANPNAGFKYIHAFTVAKPVMVFSAVQSSVTTNASRIPGAAISYTLSLQNTGHAGVSANATVTSVLDSKLRFVNAPSGTGYGAGAVSGKDGSGNGGTVTWTVNQSALATGQAVMNPVLNVIVEQVTNNATGATSGLTVYAMTTSQSTQTKINYNDGTNSYNQDNANNFNFTVGTASGATWTVTPTNSNGNPGDPIQYSFTLKNTGNHSDNYTLGNTLASGLDQAHQFYLSYPGTAITQLGSALGAGLTQPLIVVCPIPVGATDAQTIGRTITATTQTVTPLDAPTGGTTAASFTPLITTVKAPNLAVTIADSLVSGSGTAANPAPGDVISWRVTIKNNGTGNATTVNSSNTGYAHAGSNLYNTNSIDVDPTGTGTWTTGLNSGSFTGGSVSNGSGIVTVIFNQVSAGASAQYRYRVTIQ